MTLTGHSEKITFSSVLRGNSLNTCKRLWTLYQYQDKIPLNFQFYILSIGSRLRNKWELFITKRKQLLANENIKISDLP